MDRIAIYPGSFDPVTLGHLDILHRASRLFDRIIIAVAHSAQKKTLLTLEERLALLEACLDGVNGIEVKPFNGLTVEFAREQQATTIIRGLRAVSDFDYEFKLYQMNKLLNPDIETVLLMAGMDYQFLSSSMVKEVAQMQGDVSKLVPQVVLRALKKKFQTA